MKKMIRTQYMMNTPVETPAGMGLTTGWGIESEELIEVRLNETGRVIVLLEQQVVPEEGCTIVLPELARV